jgi:hypothetical protein
MSTLFPTLYRSWHKTAIVRNPKKTSLTIKGLKSKTTYYVRMRYIDKTGGVSNWSAVRKVRTK